MHYVKQLEQQPTMREKLNKGAAWLITMIPRGFVAFVIVASVFEFFHRT